MLRIPVSRPLLYPVDIVYARRLSHFHAIQSSRAGDRSKNARCINPQSGAPPQVSWKIYIFYTVHIYISISQKHT